MPSKPNNRKVIRLSFGQETSSWDEMLRTINMFSAATMQKDIFRIALHLGNLNRLTKLMQNHFIATELERNKSRAENAAKVEKEIENTEKANSGGNFLDRPAKFTQLGLPENKTYLVS
jgi:hypothetical protein